MQSAGAGGGGTSYTYGQLKAIWLASAKGTKYATNAWASLMAAIAEAESSGDPTATNPTDNGGKQTSWGLWQISNGTHSAPAGNWSNPYANARLAIGKLEGQGLGAWGTYTSGAYKGFLSDKTAPDSAGIDVPSASVGAGLTASTQGQSDCLFGKVPGFLGWDGFCLLTYGQARALIGGALLVVGANLMASGLSLAAVLAGVKAAGPIASYVTKAGGAPGKVAGAFGATSSAAAAASERKEQDAQERHTASQYRKQRRARENYARENDPEPVPF